MPKKSQIDDRIDNLFAGLHPEAHDSRAARNPAREARTSPRPSLIDQRRNIVHDLDPRPARRKSLAAIIIPAILLIAVTGFVIFRLHGNAASIQSGQRTGNVPNANLSQSNTGLIPDTQSPDVPKELTANAVSTTSVKLTWSASKDNTGVTGYTIYRNGASLATISSSDLAFSDVSASPDTAYTYAIDAYDQAGNHSAVSAPIQVTTPALPGSLIYLTPVADTYVSETSPRSIYGTSNSLRIDTSPNLHAYLRFNVAGLEGKTVNRARLMLYANSGTSMGIWAMAVTDNKWDEVTTNYFNAPVLGRQLAVSISAEAGSWITMDITPYITGDGSYTIGITGDSQTAVSLASRESGANAPQLILDIR